MKINPGTRLGPYEIVSHLGAGGMGTVYRARDTRLGRDVAIKLLPEELSEHPALRERLAREARVISGLSHPNLCSLFDVGSADGTDYLVMELLEGETLADRMDRGPIPLREALRWAAEIASALDTAHRAGIVHRDLKPGNVMLTKGRARVLDFGLASRAEENDSSPDAPTHRAPLTAPGTVVGTLPYMSPEQVRGESIDARTDLFSFGSMLYEMLTRQRAFPGESRMQVIAAITEGQPPRPSERNPDVPEAVDRIVMKCLEKDRDARWQTARDLADELQWAAGTSTESAPRKTAAVRSTLRRWQIASAILLLLLAAAAVRPWLRRAGPARQEAGIVRFGLNPPPGFVFAQRATNSELAIAPDGSRIAFCALKGGRRSLFVRPIDELMARELPGTEGAESPFWSPDSRSIAFLANGFLRKVPAAGGAVEKICPAQGGAGTWGKGGTILLTLWGSNVSEGILMVNENGGALRELSRKKGWHYWPWFLRDGHHFVYLLNVGAAPETGIYLASIEDPEGTKVLSVSSRAEATSDDVLYFTRDGVLLRQQLDIKKRTMTGQASVVAERVFSFVVTGSANFSLDATGHLLAFQRAASSTQLVVRDEEGRETARLGDVMPVRSFRISPDGRRIALDLVEETTSLSDLWMYGVERNVRTRITTSHAGTFAPIWTPDGGSLVVAAVPPSDESDPPQITLLNLAGNTVRQLLRKDGLQIPNAVTRDGRVIYTIDRGKQSDIEAVSLSGDARKVPLLSSPFNERGAALSPDGQWLAYTSDSSGSPEIYVRQLSGAGEALRVSIQGGTEPRWGPDGTLLYYITPDGMLSRVNVTPDSSSLRLSPPQAMFRISSAGMMELQEFDANHYDVEPDGRHFLVREIPGGSDEAPVALVLSPPGTNH